MGKSREKRTAGFSLSVLSAFPYQYYQLFSISTISFSYQYYVVQGSVWGMVVCVVG